MVNSQLAAYKQDSVQDVDVKSLSEENSLAKAADTSSVVRKGMWVLLVGFGGFLLWAGLAPLDEGVPTTGLVALDTKRKTVQHLNGGIVKEVLVREGERVQEGQVLLRLDEAASRANFESIRQRYLGLSAMQSRLMAEQAGQPEIRFSAEIQKAAQEDPYIRQQVNNQIQLFNSRRTSLNAELQGLREAREGLRAQLEAGQQMLVQRERQSALLKDELVNVEGLVKQGYAPRNRQLELERATADVQASIADLKGNALRIGRSIAELEQRLTARQSEYRREIETMLADVAREVLADAEKFTALKQELERVDVKAPVSGQVVGLMVQTVGAVVQPGQRLMDVVPQKQSLLLEAQIPPNLIDRVHEGLEADIRFNAFAHSPQLVVTGKVLSVSGDLLTDPGNPQSPPHYLARLEVTPEGVEKLGQRQMQPGMQAEVVIRTGERSMLMYLLHPMVKRFARAMKEE